MKQNKHFSVVLLKVNLNRFHDTNNTDIHINGYKEIVFNTFSTKRSSNFHATAERRLKFVYT